MRHEAGFVESNDRFWQIYRTVAHDVRWRSTDIDVFPFVAVWFGLILPYTTAMRRVGHPEVWCVMLGAPTQAIRNELRDSIETSRPQGLILVENNPPAPSEYTLPLVGYITERAFLTFQFGHERYDHVHGYETVAPHDEIEGLVLQALDTAQAERVLLRMLAFNVARRISPADRLDLDDVIAHARELWVVGATQAAGVVAGAALETLLQRVLETADPGAEPPRMLARLARRAYEVLSLDQADIATLDTFRELRNYCAHALSAESDVADDQELRRRVDALLRWLEGQGNRQGDEPGLVFARAPDATADPEDLCQRAAELGAAAANAASLTPVTITDGVRSFPSPGLCGYARVFVRTNDRQIIEGLRRHLDARVERTRGVATALVFPADQSVERAGAFARAFTDHLRAGGLEAWYEIELD